MRMRILAVVAALPAALPAHAVELIETQDCNNGQCTDSLPPMAFCKADAARKVLGEDASTSESFYADYERDIAGQWLFKMRSPGQVVSLRLTEQEFDEGTGKIGFAFRGAFLSGTCRRYTGQQLTSQTAYRPSHAYSRAGVGSYWNYEFVDEITGKRVVWDSVVTEVTNNREQVIRSNTRGVDNARIMVLDASLGFAQNNTSKFTPPLHWMTDELRVGAKTSWSGSTAARGPQGMGPSKPMRCESQIVGHEHLATKAGRFEAYHFEINCRRFPGPEATQPDALTHMGRWYAPAANHWVKEIFELRSGDGRLVQKYTAALIDYKLR